MKQIKILLFAIFIISTSCLNAQGFKILESKVEHVNFDFNALNDVLSALERKEMHLRTEIEKMQEYLMDILASNIDSEFRDSINVEYNNLYSIVLELETEGFTHSLSSEFNICKQNVRKKIVDYYNRISCEQEEQILKNRTGTCFAVNNNCVVTNYHVVEDAQSIIIQGINGDFSRQYNAVIVATDKYNDLALLQIVDADFEGFASIPYNFKATVSDVGEDVFVLGYPLTNTMGYEIKLTTGVISSKTGFKGDVSIYQISAPIQPGNSGGPLFDNKGNLIGVVSAKHSGTENVGYAIKTLYLKNLIESFILTPVLPNSNQIGEVPLTEKVKSLKNFIFIITCSKE